MATVYFAEDLRHQRRVALEVLHAEIAALLGTDRFLAEITTVATMQHPGVEAGRKRRRVSILPLR